MEGILDDYPDSGKGIEEEATVFAVQAHRTHGVQLLRVGETIEIELEHKVWDLFAAAAAAAGAPLYYDTSL